VASLVDYHSLHIYTGSDDFFDPDTGNAITG
jgi:hypothetical protein